MNKIDFIWCDDYAEYSVLILASLGLPARLERHFFVCRTSADRYSDVPQFVAFVCQSRATFCVGGCLKPEVVCQKVVVYQLLYTGHVPRTTSRF